MGVLHFQVYPPSRVAPDALARAYFMTRDRFLLPARIQPTEDGFRVERAVSDSGYFHIPWTLAGESVAGPGPPAPSEVTLGTAWIAERPAPYHLQVELARGKVNQLRNQMAEWQNVGLEVPAELAQQVANATRRFFQAATVQQEPLRAAQLAEEALALALRAGDGLARCYAEQALAARLRSGQPLDIWLGTHLGHDSPPDLLRAELEQTCNAGLVPLDWHVVEATERAYDWSTSDELLVFSREQKIAACSGPIVCFDDASLPAWLSLWEGDYDNILACVSEFTERAVKRYRGKFQLWHAASRLNVGQALGLSMEDRLRIAARIVEILHRFDPQTPFIVSFDQPWAEYTRGEDHEPPLYLADTIVRSGLGVSGIGLEINLGYHPGGSYLRDWLDLHQLLDLWNLLGLPLYIFLTIPSSSARDERAYGNSQPAPRSFAAGWTPEIQARLTAEMLAQLLTRPSVRGIFWNQLGDYGRHYFPHGGLYDAQRRPKPAWQILGRIRQSLLK